jgi:hypothetical protein
VADDCVIGCCWIAAGTHRIVPRPQTWISCFRSTVISHAGTKTYCGTAVGKTHGSPCL